MAYIWASPMRQFILHPDELATTGTTNVIRALPTAGPQYLRRVAARNAFWLLPRTWLVKFAEYTSTEVNKDDTAFDLVWKLVQSILGTSDDETLPNVSSRAYKPGTTSNAYEIAELDKVLDTLTKSEKQELKGVREKGAAA